MLRIFQMTIHIVTILAWMPASIPFCHQNFVSHEMEKKKYGHIEKDNL